MAAYLTDLRCQILHVDDLHRAPLGYWCEGFAVTRERETGDPVPAAVRPVPRASDQTWPGDQEVVSHSAEGGKLGGDRRLPVVLQVGGAQKRSALVRAADP